MGVLLRPGRCASGDLTQVTYLYSDTGGSTWSAPAPITAAPFKAGWGNDSNQPNLGDYIQGVAQGGALYAAYAETKQPGFADAQPALTLPTPDVSVTKVTPAAARPPLRAGTPAFTDANGNGYIDAGEQIRLRIPLVNYVSNPAQAATLNAVSAVLSSSTPGVAVSQAVSTYPNIGPGQSALNAAEFVVQVSTALAPGTPIQFSLAVTSAQGSVTLPITQHTGTPVYTTLLSQNFDGVAPGLLPSGWQSAHGAGTNTVPWVSSNSFAPSLCGTSNKAFHQNANDGPTGGRPSRWERLISPLFVVPREAQYVTVEFDVCYDLEDDPILPTLGYDGVFLRLTDQTPGRALRSVLVEAFEQEFTTDGFEHYPKHLPRNSDPNYFEDMSAWSGFSNGIQHVRMRLPGMEGSTAQLRFEFAQDGAGICSDVRPGHACGVSIDNIVVRSVVSVTPVAIDLQLSSIALRRAAGTNDVEAVLTIANAGFGTATGVQITRVLLGSVEGVTVVPNASVVAPGATTTAILRFPGTSGLAAGSGGVIRVSGSSSGGNWASGSRVTLP